MHTFTLACPWEKGQINWDIQWQGESLGRASMCFHKKHVFFVCEDQEKKVLAYADTLSDNPGGHLARLRAIDGKVIGWLEQKRTSLQEQDQTQEEAPNSNLGSRRWQYRNDLEQPLLDILEDKLGAKGFHASINDATSGDKVGVLTQGSKQGSLLTAIEIDVAMPTPLVWSIAAVVGERVRSKTEAKA